MIGGAGGGGGLRIRTVLCNVADQRETGRENGGTHTPTVAVGGTAMLAHPHGEPRTPLHGPSELFPL